MYDSWIEEGSLLILYCLLSEPLRGVRSLCDFYNFVYLYGTLLQLDPNKTFTCNLGFLDDRTLLLGI